MDLLSDFLFGQSFAIIISAEKLSVPQKDEKPVVRFLKCERQQLPNTSGALFPFILPLPAFPPFSF